MQADIVKRVFDKFMEGRACYRIANKLNEEGETYYNLIFLLIQFIDKHDKLCGYIQPIFCFLNV